jgi:hypothetical protein
MTEHCFPKTRPTDREQRAIIDEWLQTEARIAASRLPE